MTMPSAAPITMAKNSPAPAHVERDVLEREHRPPGRRPIAMAHALDDDLRLRHGPRPVPAVFRRGGKLAQFHHRWEIDPARAGEDGKAHDKRDENLFGGDAKRARG